MKWANTTVLYNLKENKIFLNHISTFVDNEQLISASMLWIFSTLASRIDRQKLLLQLAH